jgi:hypothetical protein
MKNKLYAFALLPALGLGFLGAQTASAHWMGAAVTPEESATKQAQMFQETATLLGISLDVVKEGWAEGKTISEIATDAGVSEEALRTKMEAARKAKLTTHVNALVAQGVITQAQADKRLAKMDTLKQSGKGKRGGRGHHEGGMSDFMR